MVALTIFSSFSDVLWREDSPISLPLHAGSCETTLFMFMMIWSWAYFLSSPSKCHCCFIVSDWDWVVHAFQNPSQWPWEIQPYDWPSLSATPTTLCESHTHCQSVRGMSSHSAHPVPCVWRGLFLQKWTGVIFPERGPITRWQKQSVFTTTTGSFRKSWIPGVKPLHHWLVTNAHDNHGFQTDLAGAGGLCWVLNDTRQSLWRIRHCNLAWDERRFQCPLRSLPTLSLRPQNSKLPLS